MEMPKRVLCLMDLSIVGRASLACVPSVLAACGVQCCPFPASLLSTHTGGFNHVQILDLAEFGFRALEHIVQENTHFDAVYVGYMNSPAQFCLAHKAMDYYKDSFVVVDPAVGDDGALYAGITEETVKSMRGLCQRANLITPNATESALMAGGNPQNWTKDAAIDSLKDWAGNGVSVLITSVPQDGEALVMLGQVPGEQEPFCLEINKQRGSFPGTGDLFASAVTALVLQGFPLQKAAQTAADFIAEALRLTIEGGGAVRQGIWYEPCLAQLCETVLKERYK